MSDSLLKEFVAEVLVELHVDPKMKDIARIKKDQRAMTGVARAKGLALRWSIERGVDLTPELENFATSAYAAYLKRHGPELAPIAMIQILDKKIRDDLPTRSAKKKKPKDIEQKPPSMLNSGKTSDRKS